MKSSPRQIKFSPPARSCLYQSEAKEDVLETFELGCRAVLLEQLTIREVVDKMLEFDQGIKVHEVMEDMETAIADFKKRGIIPDIKIEDVEKILSDEDGKAQNIAAARRGIMHIMFATVKKLLEQPENFAKMKPQQVAEWFKMMRQEEDSERRLLLLAAENAREDTKLKLLFFESIGGSLREDQLDLLTDDLKKDLMTATNAGQLSKPTGIVPGVTDL